MTKHHQYQSFLRNFYLSSSLYDFIFAYAIYNLLFSLKGLSVLQISILLAWWAFAAMVFEIPSGALADYWSRKKLLVIAPLIKLLCFFIWIFASGNFYLYALGFLFWSLGSSLVSGTQEALLYDNLVAFNKKHQYEKVLGKKQFYFHLSLAISTITGGIIAHFNLDWTLLLSIIPLLLSSFFAFLIKEAPKVESTEEIHYWQHIKLALKEVKTNKVLLYLFIYSFGISIFGDLEEFDQLYYQLVNLPIIAFGIVGFLWSVFNSIGAYLAYKFTYQTWVFSLFPLFGAALLFLVGSFPSIPMIFLLILSYFITSPLRVLINSRIQHQIKSLSRATVTSISAFVIESSGILITLFFGFISRIWGLPAIYLYTSFFLILLSLWSLVNRQIFTNSISKTD